jgi:putative DNA primase/helicase
MSGLTVGDISEMLRGDADAIARQALPGGSYELGRREWKVSGSQSPTGYAISVHVGTGAKQGVVGFWNGPEKGGDLIDLIEHAMGLDKFGAVQWAKAFLNIMDGGPKLTPEQLAERDRQREKERKVREAAEEKDRIIRLNNALIVWRETSPLGGAASTYLAKRGINRAYADAELRAHGGLPHPEGPSFPALVARVSDKAGATVGVWRIYVKGDGSGKAPVEAPKLGMGKCKGGAVRIGGVWPEIGIAEGVETALACRQLIHEDSCRLMPVWAALSTSGMTSIELPPEVTRVRIFADGDTAKFRKGKIIESPGMAAARELSARLEASGVRADIQEPPPGMDWLDVLQAGQQRAAA